MLNEAYRLLGVDPETDGQTIEATYWRRARELADQRQDSPDEAAELERLNWAYRTLMNERIQGPPRRRTARRPSRRRRLALIGTTLVVLVVGGLVAGLGYRDEIHSGATRGYEEGQEGWDDTINWLQSLDEEPTPQAPDAASR